MIFFKNFAVFLEEYWINYKLDFRRRLSVGLCCFFVCAKSEYSARIFISYSSRICRTIRTSRPARGGQTLWLCSRGSRWGA